MSIKAHIKQQFGKKQYDNAIVFCVDAGYLPFALFVAQQIIERDPYPVDICICLPNIAQVPDIFLQPSFVKNPLDSNVSNAKNLRFVELEVTGIENLPTDHLSLAAYHRLFTPALFANDYDYLIYLDADIFIRRAFLADLFHIINTFPTDFTVAAAPYMGEVNYLALPERYYDTKIYEYVARYHRLNHLYRNSGVLVFHVKNFNVQYIEQAIFQTTFDNPTKLESHDQSALNLTLLNKMPILPIEFNWQLNRVSDGFKEEFDPYIVHFVSSNKPWLLQLDYLEPYYSAYQQFFATYFPTLKFEPLTQLQRRINKQKYQGLREKISLFSFKKNLAKQIQLDNEIISTYKAPLIEATKAVNQGAFLLKP